MAYSNVVDSHPATANAYLVITANAGSISMISHSNTTTQENKETDMQHMKNTPYKLCIGILDPNANCHKNLINWSSRLNTLSSKSIHDIW